DLLVAVVDATNLRMNLRLVLELRRLGKPMVVALNMADVARARGMKIDTQALAQAIGCAVVETVAVEANGHAGLLAQRERGTSLPQGGLPVPPRADRDAGELQREVRRILAIAAPDLGPARRFNLRADAVLLHPVWGLLILATLLFVIFQAVFAWANAPMDAIKDGMAALGEYTAAHMAEGPLRSLLGDGAIAGAGAVLGFLPQLLILFLFILV